MGCIQGHKALRLFSIFSHHPSYVIFKKKMCHFLQTLQLMSGYQLINSKSILYSFRRILATKSLISIGGTTLPKAIFDIF